MLFVWALFILIPHIKAEKKWWDRFEEKWKRSAELAVDAVNYWSKGMPKNSAACRRSANENIAEAERMMRDRLRKQR